MGTFSTVDSHLQSRGELKSIHLAALLNDEPTESFKVLESAKNEGFFYLDFGNCSEGKQILEIVEKIYTFQKELFSLEETEKLQYDIDKLDDLKLNG